MARRDDYLRSEATEKIPLASWIREADALVVGLNSIDGAEHTTILAGWLDALPERFDELLEEPDGYPEWTDALVTALWVSAQRTLPAVRPDLAPRDFRMGGTATERALLARVGKRMHETIEKVIGTLQGVRVGMISFGFLLSAVGAILPVQRCLENGVPDGICLVLGLILFGSLTYLLRYWKVPEVAVEGVLRFAHRRLVRPRIDEVLRHLHLEPRDLEEGLAPQGRHWASPNHPFPYRFRPWSDPRVRLLILAHALRP